METLGVTSLSKSHVSEMAKDLDEMDADFRDRPLDAGPYTYVWADALTIKVRGRIVNIACLLAVGVNSEGHREILGLDLATTEDGAAGSPSSVPGRPWTLWSAAGDLRRPHRPRRHHRDHYGRCFVATMPNPLPGQPIDQGAEKLRVDGRHHGAHHIRPTRPGSGVGPAPPCRRPPHRSWTH